MRRDFASKLYINSYTILFLTFSKLIIYKTYQFLMRQFTLNILSFIKKNVRISEIRFLRLFFNFTAITSFIYLF